MFLADDTTLRASRLVSLYRVLAWAWAALMTALLIPRLLMFWEVSAGFVCLALAVSTLPKG